MGSRTREKKGEGGEQKVEKKTRESGAMTHVQSISVCCASVTVSPIMSSSDCMLKCNHMYSHADYSKDRCLIV